MVYLLAVCAAFCSAMGGVLQRAGVRATPKKHAMRLTLLTEAMRRGPWMIGLVFLVATFVLQAMALRFGDLSVVQPVLTADLLFVITILAVGFSQRIGWRELGGATAVVAGLAGFLVLAAPGPGRGVPSPTGWMVLSATVLAATVLLVRTARRGSPGARAATYGGAAALIFADNAALTKTTTTLVTEGWGHVFTRWEPYAIFATGALGFFLLQNALHAGPISASRAVMVSVNPLASITIGVFVFHEQLRTSGEMLAGEALSVGVLILGGFLLSQSPLITGVRGPGTPQDLGAAPSSSDQPP
jgi:drug/metabolite transporter (DMT)-like permease